MRGTVCRRLVLASALLLALPPGWCCYAAPPCCAAPRQRQGEPPPAPCKHCCQDEAPPGQDDQGPPPAPKRPVKRLCCEWQPTDRPEAGPHLPDLAAFALPLAVPPPPITFGGSVAVAGIVPVLPSPLHVLHCVWLC
jgi:hypothetical protein